MVFLKCSAWKFECDGECLKFCGSMFTASWYIVYAKRKVHACTHMGASLMLCEVMHYRRMWLDLQICRCTQQDLSCSIIFVSRIIKNQQSAADKVRLLLTHDDRQVMWSRRVCEHVLLCHTWLCSMFWILIPCIARHAASAAFQIHTTHLLRCAAVPMTVTDSMWQSLLRWVKTSYKIHRLWHKRRYGANRMHGPACIAWSGTCLDQDSC